MNYNGVPEQIGASRRLKAIRARADRQVGAGKVGTAILVGARLLVEHCPETSIDYGLSDTS